MLFCKKRHGISCVQVYVSCMCVYVYVCIRVSLKVARDANVRLKDQGAGGKQKMTSRFDLAVNPAAAVLPFCVWAG